MNFRIIPPALPRKHSSEIAFYATIEKLFQSFDSIAAFK
jgi:hypothetical protein